MMIFDAKVWKNSGFCNEGCRTACRKAAYRDHTKDFADLIAGNNCMRMPRTKFAML